MRYEKPVVMELGSRARRAAGDSPLACIDGGAASGMQICETGTEGIASYPTDCLAGTTVSGVYSACAAGPSALWECSAGNSATWPNACEVGPSAT